MSKANKNKGKSKVQPQRKTNKILNNSYHDGKNLKGDDYQMQDSIKVDNAYSGEFMKDSYNSAHNNAYKRMQKVVLLLLKKNEELSGIIRECSGKKFNKESINKIFDIIYKHFTADKDKTVFVNVIYLFDIVSNITGLKAKNLFDLLHMEYKQILIEELDDVHDILDSYSNFGKMF